MSNYILVTMYTDFSTFNVFENLLRNLKFWKIQKIGLNFGFLKSNLQTGQKQQMYNIIIV